jgi:hypothetical protein
MYGKYRLSEFLMPKIATLVNIRFNSIQYFNGNSTVYWRDPINIKSRYITWCNLLRNEYDIPFINIYHFNKINDFINPALIHDAKLVCKFIKEAMFLREHPSVDQN